MIHNDVEYKSKIENTVITEREGAGGGGQSKFLHYLICPSL